MSRIITLSKDRAIMSVDSETGQLFRYRVDNIEILHEGGDPTNNNLRYPKSEFIASPFGPVSGYSVTNEGKIYPMDKHGFSMEPFQETKLGSGEKYIESIRKYDGEPVPNHKYDASDSESPETISYLPHKTIKKFGLGNKRNLQTQLTIENWNEEPFRHITYWHPIFWNEGGLKSGLIYIDGEKIGNLEKIMNEPGSCFLTQADFVTYWNYETGRGFEIESPQLKNYCIWVKDQNIFAIEPGTNKPELDPEKQLYFEDECDCSIIPPYDKVVYNINIQPINY